MAKSLDLLASRSNVVTRSSNEPGNESPVATNAQSGKGSRKSAGDRPGRCKYAGARNRGSGGVRWPSWLPIRHREREKENPGAEPQAGQLTECRNGSPARDPEGCRLEFQQWN